jgi:hypothetical protein
MSSNRFGLHARRILGAVLIASPLALSSVVAGHAAVTWTCEAPMAWAVPNTTVPTIVSGTLMVYPGTCAGTNSDNLPFVSASVAPVSGFTIAYTYSGTCAEGTLAFANGAVGIFASGTLTVVAQANGQVGTVTAVGTTSATPCLGAPGSIAWWSGLGVEAGG